MAINLSANTKTTGPVSQEVFDPNIGFKSGLEGLARGIGQAGQAAGNLAQKIHTKNDNVSKQLAATNYNVAVTEMNSAYNTYDTVISNEASSKEQIAEATAAYSRFQGELTHDKIDLSQDADESYYKKYIPQLTAVRNSLDTARKTKAASTRQLKSINQERAQIHQQNAALTGAPSSSHAINQIDSIVASYEENHVFNVNDRDFIDKQLYADFNETLDTTISKLTDDSFPPADAEVELLLLKERIETFENLDSPRSKAASTSALVKVNNKLAALGKAGDKIRIERDIAHAEASVENGKAAMIRVRESLDDTTNIPAALEVESLTALALEKFPDHVSETVVNGQNKLLGERILYGVTDTGVSNLGEAALFVLNGGDFTGLSAEAYKLGNWDRSDLANNPEVMALQQKIVAEEVTVIKKGLAEGDFSVLSRIDSGYAKAWKELHTTQDPDKRAILWRGLKERSEQYRKDSNFKDLFSGTRAFGIMPKTDVAFSKLQNDQKIGYLEELQKLNGSGVYSFTQTLQNSSLSSDREIGNFMKLHQAGLADEALEDLNRGSSINAGSAMTFTDKDGNVSTVASSAASTLRNNMVEEGMITPLYRQRLAASRAGDVELASMLEKIELSQIASAVNANPSANLKEVYANLAETQKVYIDALGKKELTENETIFTVPTLNPNNVRQAHIRKNVSPKQQSELYLDSLQSVVAEALTDQEIASTDLLKKVRTLKSLEGTADRANVAEDKATNDQKSSRVARRDALDDRIAARQKAEAFRSSLPTTYDRVEENKEYVNGLFKRKVAGGLPIGDFSDIVVLGDPPIDYVVPRIKVEGKNEWIPIPTPSGKPFMIPVNDIYDRVFLVLNTSAPASSIAEVTDLNRGP